ncbi:MAG: hypothetical protein NT067_03930 [Candidatus Diapherotrites archaeon]|nr:hypothetical protein [Candidatus Diapherotrites archaeon]
MNKSWLALSLGFVILLLGCSQQAQYVCSDGRTVADKALCAAAVSTIQYVCADGTTVTDKALCPAVSSATPAPVRELTLEEELLVCSGMPELQGQSMEDICIMGLAGKHKDSSLCKRVGKDRRVDCFSLVAQVAEDPALCEQAGTQADQCYEAYARNEKDSTVCAKIKESYMRDNCYTNIANMVGDPALCDKVMVSSQKDNCYLQMAQRFGDSSYCDKISSQSIKDNCNQNMKPQSAKPVPS